ncbi:hypothetical protein AAY473_039427 [Plecturocebus cupreus]
MRPMQVDSLSPGVQDQPNQCSKTLSLQKIRKIARHGGVQWKPSYIKEGDMGFYYVHQADLELLASSNPPIWASQSVRITGMRYCVRPTCSTTDKTSWSAVARSLLTTASPVARIIGFQHVGGPGFELRTSSDPSALPSQSGGITEPLCLARIYLISERTRFLISMGRLRWADHLRSGVRDQSGQHGETPSLIKYNKYARTFTMQCKHYHCVLANHFITTKENLGPAPGLKRGLNTGDIQNLECDGPGVKQQLPGGPGTGSRGAGPRFGLVLHQDTAEDLVSFKALDEKARTPSMEPKPIPPPYRQDLPQRVVLSRRTL